ncbi:MAG: divalent metal cation transporter [Kurthia sp.]|nr:divalent metal cation transporter [Candidatus Kurthia equi]
MKEVELSKQKTTHKKVSTSVLLGAAFLMATSSIGPGFLTQTTVFTNELRASFGFVILVSLILDIFAQMNIWRIIVVSGLRGQEIANKVFPGLGYVLAGLIVFGGLAFNIGNVAGAGLGVNAMIGFDVKTGAALSAVFAIIIFLFKEASKIMDRAAQIAGGIMILLMMYVAVSSAPPVGEAVIRTFAPTQLSIFAIVTLVGGTVGGYITFAGGHRLLDAGLKGTESIPQVNKSSITGIAVTGIMRVLLFLAVLGVVTQGFILDADNPAASVFGEALGTVGLRIFGVIMWAAAITSVIGAAYTSVSFIKTFHKNIVKYEHYVIIGFILISTLVFLIIGKPVNILIIAGALNGMILPIALATLLIATHKKSIIGDYKHPKWLTIPGILVVIAMGILSIMTLREQILLLLK